MLTIHSKQHKEIVGSVNGAPYVISFDADGFAEVEDSIALQLTSGRYGVVLIDEDGAVMTKAPESEIVNAPDPDVSVDQTANANLDLAPAEASVTEEKAKKTSKKSEGSEA